MSRFLKYLLAALLAFGQPAAAQSPLLLRGAGIDDGDTATPVSQACSTISGTVTTFTAQGVGGAAPSRVSVVSINWSDSTSAGTAELNTVTIGGISMSRAVRASGDDQSSNSEIWWAANPTGTTANIVVTSSTAIDGITIGVYRLVGYNAVTAFTTGTTSVSQAYTTRQVALAAASRTVNVSTSLSNMTNDYSAACGATLWGVHASQGLNGNGTLSSSISPTTINPKIALAVWSVQTGGLFACTGTLSPSALTGLLGWWDVSVTASLNLTGPTVNSIADQSGNGNTMTGGLHAFASPSYSATGYNTTFPGILITTGVGSAMETALGFAMGTGTTLTWFVVTTAPSASANNSGRYLSYAASGLHDFNNAGSWTWSRNGSSLSSGLFSRNSVAVTPFTFTQPGNHVFAGTVDSSGNITVYTDCTQNFAAVASPGNWVSGGTFAIGNEAGQFGSGFYNTATFAEWGLATGLATPAQMGQMINGLRTKWGL